MKSRKQQFKEKETRWRQEEILHTARKLFVGVGFHHTTMDMIATEVGISKGALYLYFKSKEELFGALVKDSIEKRLQAVTDIFNKEDSCEAKIKKYISAVFEHFQQNRDLITMVMMLEQDALCARLHKEMHEKVISMMMQIIQMLTEVMKQGMREGLLRKGDPEKMALALAGIMHIFIMQGIFSKRLDEYKKDQDFIMETFLKGVQA